MQKAAILISSSLLEDILVAARGIVSLYAHIILNSWGSLKIP